MNGKSLAPVDPNARAYELRQLEPGTKPVDYTDPRAGWDVHLAGVLEQIELAKFPADTIAPCILEGRRRACG